jgi:hypothetical protein
MQHITDFLFCFAALLLAPVYNRRLYSVQIMKLRQRTP